MDKTRGTTALTRIGSTPFARRQRRGVNRQMARINDSRERGSVGTALAPRRGIRALRRRADTVRRRLLARRPALECAGLLVVVLAVTLGASWVTWQHLVDQRIHLAPARTAAGQPTPTVDIVDHDAGRSSIISSPPSASSIQRQKSGGSSGSRSSSSAGRTVTGPQLAAGAVGGTLAGGLALSWWVHRRYRAGIQQSAEPAATPIEESPSDDSPSRMQEPSMGRPQVARAAPRPVTDSRAATPPSPPAPAGGSPMPTAPEARLSPVHHTNSHSPASAGASGSHGSGSGVPVGASAPSRRLLVDRRAYHRVPFERVARLHWRESDRDVTTVDLSEAGVRIHLDASQTEAVVAGPSFGEWVDVVLPLADSTMRFRAEVMNAAPTATGTDIGLAFRNVPETHRQRLRAAVMSLRLWGPSTP
jgi:PilZ domain